MLSNPRVVPMAGLLQNLPKDDAASVVIALLIGVLHRLKADVISMHDAHRYLLNIDMLFLVKTLGNKALTEIFLSAMEAGDILDLLGHAELQKALTAIVGQASELTPHS